MRGIADQRDVSVKPLRVSHADERDPRRVCTMRCVRHETMSIEPFREHRLAGSDRLWRVHRVEACRLPRSLVAFDDERRRPVVEPVAMRLKDTVLVLYEKKCERVEWERRA